MKRLILLLLFMIPVLAIGQRRYASIPATSSGPQTWNPILAADVPSNFLRSNATNVMAGNTVFSATNYGVTFNMIDNDFSGVRDFVIDQQETVQNPYHSRFTLNSFSFRWQSDIGLGLADYIFIDPFTQSFNFGNVITEESGVTRITSLAGSGDQMVVVDNDGDLSTQSAVVGGGAAEIPYLNSGGTLFESESNFNYDAPSNTLFVDNLEVSGTSNLTETFIVACSDETTALTTGVKVTFRMPRARTLTSVRASLTTAQATGSTFTVDIHESGTTILSTLVTIDNTERTSTTAATAPVISDSALADDAEMTIEVDQVGDGTATGLKITLIWN